MSASDLTALLRSRLSLDHAEVLRGFKHDDLTESEIDLTLIGATAENHRTAPLFELLIEAVGFVEDACGIGVSVESAERLLQRIREACGGAK